MTTISILMCALDSRPQTMRKCIISQLDNAESKFEYGILSYTTNEIEYIIYSDNGHLTSGHKRQILLEKSKGKYVCFVDDDDTVQDNYISSLLGGCASNADVVSFNLNFFREGQNTETWRFGLHPNIRKLGLMCVNHLCAWKRELATKVAWSPVLGYADDRLWYEPLYHSGIVKTLYYVNASLYNYLYSEAVSRNQSKRALLRSRMYFGKGLRCFLTKQDDILIESRCQTSSSNREILVRDKYNQLFRINPLEHRYYHTVKP